MDPLYLIERMASISPGVRFHITGRNWLLNIDEDEITHQTLVNECFALMIGEAYELGIEFYCTLGDLCESFQTIDKTLLLFETVFPTPLYRSITESEPFKTMLTSVVVGGMDIEGESSIETILQQLAIYNEKTAPIYNDTYEFLQDKMKSTSTFDTYARSTLDIDNTPFSSEVSDEMIIDYLNNVQVTFSKLLKAADVLIKKTNSDESVSGIYDDIGEYKVKASDNTTLTCYAWAYVNKDQIDPLPVVQMLIEKYRIQFHASVPLYEEFFILRGNPVLANNIPALILGSWLGSTTKEAFLSNVSEVFQKLQDNGKIITNEMAILMQNITLIMVQEYYS